MGPSQSFIPSICLEHSPWELSWWWPCLLVLLYLLRILNMWKKAIPLLLPLTVPWLTSEYKAAWRKCSLKFTPGRSAVRLKMSQNVFTALFFFSIHLSGCSSVQVLDPVNGDGSSQLLLPLVFDDRDKWNTKLDQWGEGMFRVKHVRVQSFTLQNILQKTWLQTHHIHPSELINFSA